MEKLLNRWLQRPVTFIVVNLIIIVLGVLSIFNLPLELSPALEFPRISVYAFYPNSTPKMVEALVTAPIESRVQQVAGIKDINSVSNTNSAYLNITFARTTDMKFAEFQLNEILADYKSWLPDGILRPQLQKYIPEKLQKEKFLTYRFLSTLTGNELHSLLQNKVKRQLLNIDGVAAIDISGIREPVIEILLDRDVMKFYNISVAEIRQALNPKDKNVGLLNNSDATFPLIVKQRFDTINNLKELPLKTVGTRLVKLKDIALVRDNYEDLRFKKRINGRETVLIELTKESSANTLSVANAVFQQMDQIKAALPAGCELIKIDDSSAEIRKALSELSVRSFVSLIGIFILLLAGMRRIIAPLIIISAIVLSILLVFFGIYTFNMSINLLTIAGLVLGFGFMVDNAILVYDNIERHNKENRIKLSLLQSKKQPSAVLISSHSVSQMTPPILAATLTTVAAMLPFVFLTGEMRIYYLPFAIVVSFTLAASVLFSFFYVPAAWKMFSVTKNVSYSVATTKNIFANFYQSIIKNLLKRRRFVYIILILALGLPLWLLPAELAEETPGNSVSELLLSAYNNTIGSEFYSKVREYSDPLFGGILYIFFNKIDRGSLWQWRNPTYLSVNLRLPQGSAPGLSESNILRFEELALAEKAVGRIETNIWQSAAFMRIDFKNEYAFSSVPYRLKEHLISLAARMSGLIVSVTGYGDGFSGGMLGHTNSTFNLHFKGYNYKELENLALYFKNEIEKNRRVRDVDINARYGFSIDDLFFLNGHPDKEALSYSILTFPDILAYLQLYTTEYLATNKIKIGTKEFKLRLKAKCFEDFDTDKLLNDTFYINGKPIRFSQLINLEKIPTANEIRRQNQQYTRMVSFDFLGPYSFANQFLEKTLSGFALPVGYSIERRSFQQEEEQHENLFIVILLGVLFIYMVTASLYESFRDPFLIFLTIPSGLFGIVWMFFFLDTHFGSSAYIGVIFISGIVVNNSILLVNRFQKNLRNGMDRYSAIFQGSLHHFRPLVLTTLSTVIGFLPFILFSANDSSNIWYALSLAGIGGIISSAFFIFFILPLLFYSFGQK